MKFIERIWPKSEASNLDENIQGDSTLLNHPDGKALNTSETQGDWKQSLIQAHLKAAESYAELSHSRRAKVGAVIVKDHRVVSVGYNGMPSGWDNNCEDELKWPNGVVVHLVTKKEVLHAEMNALMFAARNGIPTDGASLVMTLSPCFECSKAIYQAGIKSVFYRDQYRDTSGIDFLRQCRVHVAKA